MIKLLKKFLKVTYIGFMTLCDIISKGFYFYFYIIFLVLYKIFRFKFLFNICEFLKNKKNDYLTFLFLSIACAILCFLYVYLYVPNNDIVVLKDVDKSSEIVKNDKNNNVINNDSNDNNSNNSIVSNNGKKLETNLYRIYGGYDINNLNFNELRNTNYDVVSWITVDGTSINYPVVQTENNDYYLNHDIKRNVKISGWVFMDYRNSLMEDYNTIFYGHNLLNKTGFGSLKNIKTNNWFNNSNKIIAITTENNKYLYQIFSYYEIDPEVYYLSIDFNEESYSEFLNTIKGRSYKNFGIDVSTNDKIITLSTCTDDNKGRLVVHAKLISVQ